MAWLSPRDAWAGHRRFIQILPGFETIGEVKKVAAHVTCKDARNWTHDSNDLADHYANLGRELHPQPTTDQIHKLGQQLADLEVVSQLVVQLLPLFPICARAELRREIVRVEPKPKKTITHDWIRVGCEYHQCRQCLVMAGAQPPMTRCRRAGSTPLYEAFVQQGHRLASYATDDGQALLLCVHCGYYSAAMTRRLSAACRTPIGAGGMRSISRVLRGWHPNKEVRVRHVSGQVPVLPNRRRWL